MLLESVESIAVSRSEGIPAVKESALDLQVTTDTKVTFSNEDNVKPYCTVSAKDVKLKARFGSVG